MREPSASDGSPDDEAHLEKRRDAVAPMAGIVTWILVSIPLWGLIALAVQAVVSCTTSSTKNE